MYAHVLILQNIGNICSGGWLIIITENHWPIMLNVYEVPQINMSYKMISAMVITIEMAWCDMCEATMFHEKDCTCGTIKMAPGHTYQAATDICARK